MGVAALILGILGGLSGLSLASLGAFVFAVNGAQGGIALVYAIPLASIIGGGVSIAAPAAGAVLMALSAGAWFWVGAQFGYGINFITFAPMAFSGVGALLAFGSFANATSSNASAGRINVAPEPEARNAGYSRSASSSSANFDRAKWNALIKYDPDLSVVAEKLKPLGQKWIDELGASYLALSDKKYLPAIVQKIISDARAEHEALEEKEQRIKQQVGELTLKRQADIATAKSTLKDPLLITIGVGVVLLAIVGATVGLVSKTGTNTGGTHGSPNVAGNTLAVQTFGENGWLIDSGDDHGADFKSYLVSKQLGVDHDGNYYSGVERVETSEGGHPGVSFWNFRARCTVRPDLANSEQIGIFSWQGNSPAQFTQVRETGPAANVERGWYTLWWAVCKGVAKSF